MTAAEALRILRQGNDAFLAGSSRPPLMDREVRLRLAEGQHPFAAYVTCSDSRVPPELLFGRGLGDLFIVRNAGNTLDATALGSLEFAVAVLKVPLIVVMGHEGCGAVQAAVEVVRDDRRIGGNMGRMIQPILAAVLESRSSGNGYDDAVRQNVRRVVRELRHDASPLLIVPQASGTLQVVGAYYSLKTGAVDFFDLADELGRAVTARRA
jgi:carbonic anhydrase